MRDHHLTWIIAVFIFGLVTSSCGDSDSGNGGGTAADTGGSGGGGDTGGPPPACPTQCPTPLPSAGVNPRVVFHSIEFGSEPKVVLLNLTNSAINIGGWQLCKRPIYRPLPDFSLEPGVETTIHLSGNGPNDATNINLATPLTLGPDIELALYRSADFDNSADMVAYVRWGSPASGITRESLAVDAGLWTAGDFVPICDGGAAIIANGSVDISSGWESVDASCL